jgi:hypothetical protein
VRRRRANREGQRGSNPGAEDVVIEYCEVALAVGADELEGPLLEDGFEPGDTSAWTATVPG